MAVNLYDGFTNEIAGEFFRCISYNKDAITFEWIVQPNGYVPFEHTHLNQDEIFHIQKGELRMVVEGKEYLVSEGESLTVPKGKAHIAYNNTGEVLECVVEYRPGLDTFKFFQCFGGLTIDKDMSKNGTVSIPKMLYFTKKMKAQCITRPTKIPAPVFKLAVNLFYLLGIIAGWHALYLKYTGEGVIDVSKDSISL